MDRPPFDVIICDDTKPMRKSPPLMPEERRKEEKSIARLKEKFFGNKNDLRESSYTMRIAV